MITKKTYTLVDMDRTYGTLTFAEIIRSFRLCEEISQKDYATKLKISAANLCDLEKGRKIPTPRRAADIADKLGLSEELLVKIALQDQLRSCNLNYKVTLAA